MKNNSKYDIFISYRRKDVGDKAEHLKDLLEPYFKKRISFDRENLTGRFNVALIERIASVKDFILVLGRRSFVYNDGNDSTYTDHDSKAYKTAFAPDTVLMYEELSKCSVEECIKKIQSLGPDFPLDYVRIEIGRALHRDGIHIIPVVPERTDKFNFSTLELPADISGVKNYEAVFYSDNPDALFKSVVPSIRKHLKSKSDRPVLRILWFVISILLIFVLIFGGILLKEYNEDRRAYSLCHAYGDYYQYSQENHRFFNNDCDKIISSFEYLQRGGYAYVNNTSAAKQKDSIAVCWADDITICQLTVIVGMLDSMMYIPAGTFIMGTDEPLDDEKPAHKVTLTHDFYISKYELTRNEWFAIMNDSIIDNSTARLPMTDISWDDCQRFIHRLNDLTGLSFTLPTEAQWEYAASGAGLHNKIAGDGSLNDVSWHRGNSMGRLHATYESLSPNAFELYNMQGNVEEWCQDIAYQEYTSSPVIDPQGMEEGNKRIVRGGSYLTEPVDMTITYRDASDYLMKSKSRGMRLLLKDAVLFGSQDDDR